MPARNTTRKRVTGKDPCQVLRAQIHVARKDTGMDRSENEETYRGWVYDATGQRSLKGLDQRQLQRVLGRIMTETGWRPGQSPGRNGGPGNYNDPKRRPMYGKIYAMMDANGWPWKYVRATANRMFGKGGAEAPLEFLSLGNLHKLTSALQIHSNRLAARNKK